MSDKNWVLVCDSSRARLFTMSERTHKLAEIASFANSEGRSQDGELASYDGGISARPAPRSGPQQPSALDHAVEVFAKELARHLEQARTEQRYQRLYVVAGPEFLGYLRQNLSKDVANLVVEEIDKDISWFSARDIESYLQRKLAPSNQ